MLLSMHVVLVLRSVMLQVHVEEIVLGVVRGQMEVRQLVVVRRMGRVLLQHVTIQ